MKREPLVKTLAKPQKTLDRFPGAGDPRGGVPVPIKQRGRRNCEQVSERSGRNTQVAKVPREASKLERGGASGPTQGTIGAHSWYTDGERRQSRRGPCWLHPGRGSPPPIGGDKGHARILNWDRPTASTTQEVGQGGRDGGPTVLFSVIEESAEEKHRPDENVPPCARSPELEMIPREGQGENEWLRDKANQFLTPEKGKLRGCGNNRPNDGAR